MYEMFYSEDHGFTGVYLNASWEPAVIEFFDNDVIKAAAKYLQVYENDMKDMYADTPAVEPTIRKYEFLCEECSSIACINETSCENSDVKIPYMRKGCYADRFLFNNPIAVAQVNTFYTFVLAR